MHWSDSEPDRHMVEKEKKLPQKSEMGMHDVESTATASHAHLAPVVGIMPTVSLPPLGQDNNELAEMRAMFKDMKTLTKRNSVYVEMLANAEQTRLNILSKQQTSGTRDVEVGSGLDIVSHERAVLAE